MTQPLQQEEIINQPPETLPFLVPKAGPSLKACHLMLDEKDFDALKIYSILLKGDGKSDGSVNHVIQALIQAALPKIRHAVDNSHAGPRASSAAVAPKKQRAPRTPKAEMPPKKPKLTVPQIVDAFNGKYVVGSIFTFAGPDKKEFRVVSLSPATPSQNAKYSIVKIRYLSHEIAGEPTINTESLTFTGEVIPQGVPEPQPAVVSSTVEDLDIDPWGSV